MPGGAGQPCPCTYWRHPALTKKNEKKKKTFLKKMTHDAFNSSQNAIM
jgi:hypothetical protein